MIRWWRLHRLLGYQLRIVIIVNHLLVNVCGEHSVYKPSAELVEIQCLPSLLLQVLIVVFGSLVFASKVGFAGSGFRAAWCCGSDVVSGGGCGGGHQLEGGVDPGNTITALQAETSL